MVELLANVFRQDGGKQGEELTVRKALQKAEPELRRKLAGQPQVLAVLLTTIGSVYHDLGSYDESRRLLEEALRLATEGGQPDERCAVLTSLGVLEQTVGAYDRAEAFYRQSFEVARQEHGMAHP